MTFIEKMHKMAQTDIKRIVLPEGEEERTIKASEILKNNSLAEVILIGDASIIQNKAAELSVNICGIEIVDPKNSEKTEVYAKEFYELRKNKGMTIEKAAEMMKDCVYFGTMMLKMGEADGMVSGAVHYTGDLLRPGMQIVKTAPGIKVISSFFIMELPHDEYGEDGLLLFADSAVNINPTAEELAAIAISTADNAKLLCDFEPKVAMLSFSTMGSAKHEKVDKVVKATEIAKNARPDLQIDGELQLDAAIVASVAKQKAPNSTVAGKANVLIFPDIQSGNIGYKLVQRFARAKAIGPVCQGFAKPINDLSRGCSVDDIVNVVAVTAVQAQIQK
ncbi:phosphate acetyltransferase [Clostridium estertheticum]|uniref:phosphate acetyltransferase n=1 Tax=Clostridium estertheticum TaxID=238834 RepID=UPI001CF3A5CB|nr:phosphate acetyltransferase [Clostridium estertheticum]MCB2307663.1 phosphate acetyltransferase [Clostridium estertheticum]MCB2346007.1 phosphate acetyltransferase [Clostridium estertheticum]MCB2351266.1 phosphate acetyltransferase [Clostridium estertheticum]WAG44646.1 phosphate acetyltransferase [Clostridium estertheticum]